MSIRRARSKADTPSNRLPARVRSLPCSTCSFLFLFLLSHRIYALWPYFCFYAPPGPLHPTTVFSETLCLVISFFLASFLILFGNSDYTARSWRRPCAEGPQRELSYRDEQGRNKSTTPPPPPHHLEKWNECGRSSRPVTSATMSKFRKLLWLF